MDSGRKLELEETEGWIEIVSPEKQVILLETELKESKEKIANAESLKQDVRAYLQDTVNVLKSLDLAKLDTQKLEKELKDTRQALELAQKEKEKIASIFTTHIDNHGDTMNDLQMMKEENTQLKNQKVQDAQKIQELKQRLRKQKKLKKTYRTLSKRLMKELDTAGEIIFLKTKLNTELSMQLHTANLWSDHFENLTNKQKAELAAVAKENANQKEIIEKLSRSNAGFFSPKPIKISGAEQKPQAKPF